MNSNPIMYDKVIQSLCLLDAAKIYSSNWIQDYRTLLPYCVKRTKYGKFIILDRNYKPLGFPYCKNQRTPDLPYDDDESFIEYCVDESDLDFSDVFNKGNCFRGFLHAYLYDGTCPPHSKKKFVREYRRRLISMFKL